MKKTVFFILILISLLLILARFLEEPIRQYLNLSQIAGIKILSSPAADVYIDSVKVGKTPYEDKNLKPTQYLIKLENGKNFWEGKVNLKSGTITVINRELGESTTSSSGEILTLEKGDGITVLSNPSGAEVEIDGHKVGKTANKFKVGVGEHLLVLSHENYLNRSIKASIPEGYNLNLIVDLSLTEVNLVPSQTQVTTKLIIKPTPTGFLRVRDKPSLNGLEIARVNTGDELVLLEETNSAWDKVRLSDGKEGYVATQYISKSLSL